MIKQLDRTLMVLLLLLIGFGLVQVYSASYIYATERYDNGLYFFVRQCVFACIGLAVLLISALMPLRYWEKFGWLVWAVSVLGIIGTFIPGLGHSAGGAARWIAFPYQLRFEPSEFLKIGIPLLLAHFLKDEKNLSPLVQKQAPWKWPAVWRLLVLVLPLALLLKQPDFGSFALSLSVIFMVLFLFGLRMKWILWLGSITLPIFFIAVYGESYRWARVKAFIDPWADPANKGFQVIQSMTSFSSGGWMGVGLGQGQGKLFFLPEAHTDFTFAIVGEELGFVGVMTILLMFGGLLFRCYRIAFSAPDSYSQVLGAAMSSVFSFSVILNIAVALGLAPTKGLTLPFLSYGGSSLVSACLGFGILLSLARHQKSRQDQLAKFLPLRN